MLCRRDYRTRHKPRTSTIFSMILARTLPFGEVRPPAGTASRTGSPLGQRTAVEIRFMQYGRHFAQRFAESTRTSAFRPGVKGCAEAAPGARPALSCSCGPSGTLSTSTRVHALAADAVFHADGMVPVVGADAKESFLQTTHYERLR